MFDVLKGGYGKSTLSVNVADRLSDRGHNVLYVDLDPNGHITSVLGFDDVYEDPNHDYGYIVSNDGWYQKATIEPHDMVFETDWGWDFIPAYSDLESFNETLKSLHQPSMALKNDVFTPLFDTEGYDYAVIDGGGERSKLADNGFVAGERAIIPICPGQESVSALKRTYERVVSPLTDVLDTFEVISLVPNLLQERLDQQTRDRQLLEKLNAVEQFKSVLPPFARITQDEFRKIDAGNSYDLPGVRKSADISKSIERGVPVSEYNADSQSIQFFTDIAVQIETTDPHEVTTHD